MSSLLVIGGTGFFGKSIIDFFNRGNLEEFGIELIYIMSRNANNFPIEYQKLLTNINTKVKFLSEDISAVKELPSVDFIIHAASSSNAQNYINASNLERENIINSTLNFCKLVPKYCANCKVIYISSGAIYGAQNPELSHIKEDENLVPVESLEIFKRDYAQAKRDSEEAILKLGSTKNIKVSIARCFSFVGVWLPFDLHFAIGNFIKNILEKKEIVVKAQNNVYRSYMYADDLVYWLMKIMFSANNSCPTYNVGSDEAWSILDLAKFLSEKYKLELIKPEVQNNKIDRYIPSIEKAKKELNIDLKYNLGKAVEKTLEFCKLN